MGDEWRGTNPFYLMIRHAQLDGAIVHTVVDLDEEGWTTIHSRIMRLPGRWYLVRKEDRTMPIVITVAEGEQPYYVARHVGIGSETPESLIQTEVIAYGLGKKRTDGHVDRLWHFHPQGVTVAGDDVDDIGVEIVKAMAVMGVGSE